MKDVAIIAFAQFPHTRCEPLLMDPEMMSGVVDETLGQVGLQRQEIDFYCAGSTDYLSGLPFSFVHVLDAIGPWPPAYESHVEMDGAWALYESGVLHARWGEGEQARCLLKEAGKIFNDIGNKDAVQRVKKALAECPS